MGAWRWHSSTRRDAAASCPRAALLPKGTASHSHQQVATGPHGCSLGTAHLTWDDGELSRGSNARLLALLDFPLHSLDQLAP